MPNTQIDPFILVRHPYYPQVGHGEAPTDPIIPFCVLHGVDGIHHHLAETRLEIALIHVEPHFAVLPDHLARPEPHLLLLPRLLSSSLSTLASRPLRGNLRKKLKLCVTDWQIAKSHIGIRS